MFVGRSQRADECVPPFTRVAADRPLPLDRLDLLARMPIPLRRPFKLALEPVAARHGLEVCALMGGEWYAPFDALMRAGAGRPGMVVTPWSPEPLCDHLLGTAESIALPRPDIHPACAALLDPLGAFTVFAVIPLVFLVDHEKLGSRPAPCQWSDLLGPAFAGEVVFGGWRPHAGVPFTDYNQFLLLSLAEEFGAEGVRAFAAAVKGLRHNVVSARTAGSGHAEAGAVTVLPWLQAEMAPRRDRVSVIWPEDGAYAMPIGFVADPRQLERLRPLMDVLTGPESGRMLMRNCYPPLNGSVPGALKWLGWDRVRAGGLAERVATAGRLFFESWGGC